MHPALKLQRSDRDLPALTVLALLVTGPRHTYEMHRIIIDTHKSFVTGLPRSLYHATDRLQRDGLVRVQETGRAGARPERIVYTLTPAGRATLDGRVRRLIEVPEPDATLFVAALSFIAFLDRETALAALRVRLATLTASLAAIDTGLAGVPAGVPRLLLADGEFERARIRAEHEFVQKLTADVERGDLPWLDPTD